MFYHEYSSYYVTKDKIKVTEKKKKTASQTEVPRPNRILRRVQQCAFYNKLTRWLFHILKFENKCPKENSTI